jgi:class 3 adenylate cyclase
MATSVSLGELNSALDEKVKMEMESNPEIVNVGTDFDKSKMPIEARKWLKVNDVVVVVADLKNSTLLAHSRHDGSLGAIYEAAIGGITQIFDAFEVDYFQAQGDGGVAIFWGEDRYERAICAAITLKTFSADVLVPSLGKKFENLPETGYKVGVASGDVLVKKVGKPRDLELQTPVWARNPVNYAAKCAQQTEVHKMLVTASVWAWIETNDFIAVSCGCKGEASNSIWSSVVIDHLRPEDDDRFGRVLSAKWCENCGENFCSEVLAGKKVREKVATAREALTKELSRNAFEKAARKRKADELNTRKGLRAIR